MGEDRHHERLRELKLSMIVLVHLASEGPRTADDLMRRFETEETVIEAWQITGEHDFVVRMVAGDMTGYDELTRRLFVENDAVAGFQALVLFRQTKTPANRSAWAHPA